mgnify:CR=1 FL=1
MINILILVSIVSIFIFQNLIDPYLIQFLNNDQVSITCENPDEVLIKRLRKSKYYKNRKRKI